MRNIVLACLIVCVASIAAACGPAAAPTSAPAGSAAPTSAPTNVQPGQSAKFTVAIVPPALVSPYFITLADSAKASAAKNSAITLSVIAPSAETAIDEQVKIVEDLVQKKVNLIAVSSSNWDALTPALKKANDQGIYVVCIDRVIALPGVDVVSMLGVDEIKGGELVGDFAVKTLNGTGKVAVLEGVTGDYWSERRTQGFHNIVGKTQGIQVVTTQPANWERAKGMDTAENILQAHKDLDLIWGLNDNMALGALQAVTAANLNSQIKVVGYNADKEAVEAVKAGKMIATVAQQPAKIAQTIVEDIVPKLMNGQRNSIEPVIYIPVVLVTKDNVDSYLQ